MSAQTFVQTHGLSYLVERIDLRIVLLFSHVVVAVVVAEVALLFSTEILNVIAVGGYNGCKQEATTA